MTDKTKAEARQFTVMLDFGDPEGFMNQVNALTDPKDLYALLQQLSLLSEKVEAAGIYVTGKLIGLVAKEEAGKATDTQVEGLTRAEEKLFEGKVAQA